MGSEDAHASLHDSYRTLFVTIEKYTIENNYDKWFLEGVEYGMDHGSHREGKIEAYKHCAFIVGDQIWNNFRPGGPPKAHNEDLQSIERQILNLLSSL